MQGKDSVQGKYSQCKAKTPKPNAKQRPPVQDKDSQWKEKTPSVRQRPKCKTKTHITRQILTVQRQRPPVQDKTPVHGKDPQCKAKTPVQGKDFSARQFIAIFYEVKTVSCKGLTMVLKGQQGHKTRKSSSANDNLESVITVS